MTLRVDLEPAVFRRYLRARGWSEVGQENKDAPSHRYTLVVGEDSAEVEVPRQRLFADYGRRITEMLAVVAAVEDRPIEDLVAGLLRPETDVIRFRIDGGSDTATGTISLDEAIRLREGRKKMLLAVAHTLVEPLSHFARLSRLGPQDFVSSCREGRGELGSYVSDVFVPISPSLGQQRLDQQGLDDPFARRVTAQLMTALTRTEAAVSAGDDDLLLGSADQGVSANFLEGLASLKPASGLLEVGFIWAATRRPPPNIHQRPVRFGQEVFPTLEEAARVLRNTFEFPGYELEGFVATLHRDENHANAPGVVDLVVTLDGRTTKVRSELDAPSYAVAQKAHKSADRVRVFGTLAKEGRRFTLKHPDHFTLLSEDEAGG